MAALFFALTFVSPVLAQAPGPPPVAEKPLPPPPPPPVQDNGMVLFAFLGLVLLVQLVEGWLLWKKLQSMTHLFEHIMAQMFDRRLTDLENEINNQHST